MSEFVLTGFALTESGRLLDFSFWREDRKILEFSNGAWGPSVKPVSSEDVRWATRLTDEEVLKLTSSQS